MTGSPLAAVPPALVPLLGELCDALRQTLADARDALTSSDMQTLRESAHALKGAAMRFGLPTLADAAARAEEAASRGNLEGMEAILSEFEKGLDELAALV
ncbi:Hpt domain-containing protein [Fundidesulfovibrio putealis]|uniref:Hpt domain-containing protein n=1 Tax=Fundidesulfovibrio putealis TaxID=270496 RepID=UPI00040482C4|nr:Hpt domain-containing protein [Fundidesulfovibrio putealis]